MQETQKYILYLITKAEPLGGAQRYVLDLATNPPEGARTKVAYGEEGSLAEELKKSGIETKRISSLQNNMNPFQSTWMLLKLILLFLKEKPDVVHINSSKAGVFGSFAARIAGVPNIIFTSHGWSFNEDLPSYQKTIRKFAQWLTLVFAHQTLCVSEMTRSQILHWPFAKSRTRVVYNGVDMDVSLLSKEEALQKLSDTSPSLKQVLARTSDTFVIGALSELHPVKGLRFAIDAIEEVVKKHPNTVFIVLGEGKDRDNLEKQIKDKNLEDNVFLLGYVGGGSAYVKAFDVFLQSSTSEALPYAPLEAGRAGVSVVATKVGGIPEIISSPDIGIVIPPRDPEAIQSTLLELIEDQEKRKALGNALRNRVDSVFSKSAMLQNTHALY